MTVAATEPITLTPQQIEALAKLLLSLPVEPATTSPEE